MEIRKDTQGKWISPMYGNYLTQTSATKDEDRVIVKQVYIPNEESNDEWEEITQEDADRIIAAKKAARGEIGYPQEKVNQMIGLLATSINKMELTDDQSLNLKIYILSGKHLSIRSWKLGLKSCMTINSIRLSRLLKRY